MVATPIYDLHFTLLAMLLEAQEFEERRNKLLMEDDELATLELVALQKVTIFFWSLYDPLFNLIKKKMGKLNGNMF